jgi:DNA-binding response OmpR family regulator
MNKKILVVEDEEGHEFFMAQSLEDVGEVIRADAVDDVKETVIAPDSVACVVLDLQIFAHKAGLRGPGQPFEEEAVNVENGFDALNYLVHTVRFPEAHLLVASSFANSYSDRLKILVNPVRVFSKPFSSKRLKERIRNILIG